MKNQPLSKFIISAQAGIACGQRDDKGTAQLRLNNLLTNGAVDFVGHIRIPSDLVTEEMLLQSGDVLFNNTNSVELVGKTAYFAGHHEKITFSNHITRLRVRSDELDSEYLALWLQHQWRAKVFEGMCDRWIGQAAVQRSKLEALEIPISSITEQRAIAARLKTQLAEVEIARQAAEAQYRDTQNLSSRVLKDIFSDLDMAPKAKIGDIAATTSGSTPARGYKNYWLPAEIPWVKTAEVAFAPITETEEAISRTALEECSLTLLPPKTVLIAMYGQGKTRGQSAILEIPATTNQACFAILPNDTWEPEFLYFWLKSSYQDLRDVSEDRGGNQANLNGALLKALEIPAPKKTEQLIIVERVKAALTEIEAISNSCKATLEYINLLPTKILSSAFDAAA
ncbi:hypothetical protein ARNL5_00651 [Anaerolineae bacterium]|uniref:restriction endonuclease subunit S n=1 Tax=Geobacter sp. TaxID=46610 RepID=UPI001ACC5C79|nr:restriction endonuclease subunit S [Geobacter sp.]CAG0957626.1 hypothetical protein ARNL5_00651 [Anaerolineae bacterium]